MKINFISAAKQKEDVSTIRLSADRITWNNIISIMDDFLGSLGEDIIAYTVCSEQETEKAIDFLKKSLTNNPGDNNDIIDIDLPVNVYRTVVPTIRRYENHGYTEIRDVTKYPPPLSKQDWDQLYTSLGEVSDTVNRNVFGLHY